MNRTTSSVLSGAFSGALSGAFSSLAGRAPLAGLLVALIILPAARESFAATKQSKSRDAKAAAVIATFRLLAQQRPWRCAKGEPVQAAPDWQAKTAQCAWQNRLQMRQWVPSQSHPDRCLTHQAVWWRWQLARHGIAAPMAAPVWDRGWRAQSAATSASALQRIAVIRQASDGRWIATEWTWTPSLRAATRKWQAGRWKLLADAAGQLRAPPRNVGGPETLALREAWEKNLKGRAGEVLPDAWRWESNGTCLRMETVGLSQAQLHLPYSRDEVRHEQRAAMQVQLARRFPKATWLMPFRLLRAKDADKGA
ncbi:hypothetical protein, partial [Massilia glaciei]